MKIALDTNVLAYEKALTEPSGATPLWPSFADCRKRLPSSRYRFLASFSMCSSAKAENREATPAMLC